MTGVAYFYLYSDENQDFGMKSCWVRNLQPAPEEVDKVLMEAGHAPMMPREFCKHPEGLPPFEKEELHIAWMEEGDAAALVYKGDIMAIIPAWGGINNFSGFAREALGQGDLAWEIQKGNVLPDRVIRAHEFWGQWQGIDNPFNEQYPVQMELFEKHLGKTELFYAPQNMKNSPRDCIKLRENAFTFSQRFVCALNLCQWSNCTGSIRKKK